MTEEDFDLFEKDLCRLKPARPPEELLARLAAAAPVRSEACVSPRAARQWVPRWTSPLSAKWRHWLRWLVPTAATALLVAGFLLSRSTVSKPCTAATSIRPE